MCGIILRLTRRFPMSPYNLSLTLENILLISQTFLDILIMWFLLYYAIKVIRNNSRTIQIFKGILFVVVVDVLAKFFGLNTVGFLADMFVNWGILAIIIVFQPEIRQLLERMGKTSVFSRITTLSGNEKEKLVDEIVTATMLLSKNQTGALISIEQGHSLSDYIKTGTPLNSNVTAELLTSIFVTTTPLHDGAVIIQGDKIACASAYFPPTNLELPSKYGARHRAAIGISEITDSITIVVSEETGNVSIAENGQIFGVNRKQLRDYLLRVICGISTELIGIKADSDVAIAKEFKEEVESGKVKEDTSVLDILSIKKQSENVSKIETEAIVSDGEELIVVKEDKEQKATPVKNNKKKGKRRGLFTKKAKEEQPKNEEVIIEEELDKEEQSIKLPHKKEKPVIDSYEEAMSKQRVEQQKAIDEQKRQQQLKQQKAKAEAEALKKAEEQAAKEAVMAAKQVNTNHDATEEKETLEQMPEKVVQVPKEVARPQRQARPKYNRPYESTANIRVMGMDPMAQNTTNNISNQAPTKLKEEPKQQFDTDDIDISKLMGYENELDNSFEILDKGYHQTKKGGNK